MIESLGRPPEGRVYRCPHCRTYLFECNATRGRLYCNCPRCHRRLLVLLNQRERDPTALDAAGLPVRDEP